MEKSGREKILLHKVDKTLDVIRIGTEKKNFKILRMLPADTKSIMKEIGLTKVPVNVRLNKLQKFGLVRRYGDTIGNTVLTDFGKDLISAVDECSTNIEIIVRNYYLGEEKKGKM